MEEIINKITNDNKPDKRGNRILHDKQRDCLLSVDHKNHQTVIGRVSKVNDAIVLTIHEMQVNQSPLTKTWSLNLHAYNNVDVIHIITEAYKYTAIKETISNHTYLTDDSGKYNLATQVAIPSYVMEKQYIDASIGPIVDQMGIEWFMLMKTELSKPYMTTLSNHMKVDRMKRTLFPKPSEVFKALRLCPVSRTRVVFIADEPYRGEYADGLAFSSQDEDVYPDKLINLFKECEDDAYQGLLLQFYPELTRWAHQGVLLLNSRLTSSSYSYGAYRNYGWELFTMSMIRELTKQKDHVVYVLFGEDASLYRPLIDETKNLVIATDDPSDAYQRNNTFFDSKIFSRVNEYLRSVESANQYQVVW